jgi:hypothetical protein
MVSRVDLPELQGRNEEQGNDGGLDKWGWNLENAKSQVDRFHLRQGPMGNLPRAGQSILPDAS